MNFASIAIRLITNDPSPIQTRPTYFTTDLAKALYAVAIHLCKGIPHREAWERACAKLPVPNPHLHNGIEAALGKLAEHDIRPLLRMENAPLNAAERGQLLRLTAHADEQEGDGEVTEAWHSVAKALGLIYLLAALETGYGNVPAEESREVARVFSGEGYAPRELSGPGLDLSLLSAAANHIWLKHILPELSGDASTASATTLPPITHGRQT